MQSNRFYNKSEFYFANKFLKIFFKIISMPYYPVKISNTEYIDYYKPLTYEYLKYIVKEKRFNIFFEYYQKRLENIISKSPVLVGISINYPSQVLAGLSNFNYYAIQ